MTWRDATIETAEFLSRMTPADLQNPETWPLLTTLVQIMPDDDILPVRAKYSGELQATIGINYLSSNSPLAAAKALLHAIHVADRWHLVEIGSPLSVGAVEIGSPVYPIESPGFRCLSFASIRTKSKI